MGEETASLTSSDRLCRDIASTRRRIEEDANALRSRISTRELFRPITDRVKGTLGEGGEKILEAFRENPIPLGLAGIGLGWLLLRDSMMMRRGAPASPSAESLDAMTDEAKEAAHQVGAAASHAASAVSEKAGAVSERVAGMARQARGAAKEGVRKTADFFTRTLEENPFALAVGAMAVGMVAGLLAPITRKEEETLGKIGEHVAKSVLQEGSTGASPASAEATPKTPRSPEGRMESPSPGDSANSSAEAEQMEPE
jgi:ElaB/YqjD/DUF883 family membrane-anchored ribosome-binding protein